MCDRCRAMEKHFETVIHEATELFPPDRSEAHLARLVAENPDLDVPAYRAALSSMGEHFPLAHNLMKVAVEFLLSNCASSDTRTAALVLELIGRSEARRRKLLLMESGSSGGVTFGPAKTNSESSGSKPN
jgi:hypothetical protein